MKRTEIITLFTLFVSVFVLVGVLRYLNLYEGLQDDEEEAQKVQTDTFDGGATTPTPPTPPTPPTGGGPSPTSGGDPSPASASVIKFSAF